MQWTSVDGQQCGRQVGRTCAAGRVETMCPNSNIKLILYVNHLINNFCFVTHDNVTRTK